MKTYKRSKIHDKKLKISIKFYKKGKQVERYISGTAKRFLSKLRGCSADRIDIRVEYGKQKDCFGKEVMFYNNGSYTNKKDAIQAFKAFIE